MKKTDKLRKEFDHYENKLNRLHFDVARAAKSSVETEAYVNIKNKFDRNEDKLKTSKSEYESSLKMSTALVEEVTNGCWKDLFPLLLKLTQLDVSLANDEQKVLNNLKAVTKSLSKVQKRFDLDPDTRIEQLKTFGDRFGEKDEVAERQPREETIEKTNSGDNNVIISGVQNFLRESRDQPINSSDTPLTCNTKMSRPMTMVGTPRIRSFNGESPKVEVDFKNGRRRSDRVKSHSTRSSTSRSRTFTGESTDQNATMKYKIKGNSRPSHRSNNKTDQSHCGSSIDPFNDIDDDSVEVPLTPVARYR